MTAGEVDAARAPASSARPGTRRKALCVSPRYVPSFGTFDHSVKLTRARAFQPSQGILVIAAWLESRGWDVRVIDQNLQPLREQDLRWAEIVMVSGMHVQRDNILEIVSTARRYNVPTVLGGPSVSAAPHWYPEPDFLHVGELGDATERLAERLERSLDRPAGQEVYQTKDRVPLDDFPIPAYHLVDAAGYLNGCIQSSSGCPFRCEFCDIPELYGRNPRLKSPEHVTRELGAILAAGIRNMIYFVDDNFIGNPHAAKRLLEELVLWQERNHYPVDFSCEATLNIVQRPDLLALMRQARFVVLFIGIETPEENALRAMEKRQNLRSPIVEAIETINSYGIEVASGIILGLDTDTPETYDRVRRFIDASHIPILTINLLQALPRTPLWRRLDEQGRILAAPGAGESNIDFLLPRHVVMDGWRQVVGHAYQPSRILGRYMHHIRHTYGRRLPLPRTSARNRPAELPRGIRIMGAVLWRCGVRAHYRADFWRMAATAIRRGDIEGMMRSAISSHHLITFARDALDGRAEKSFYAESLPRPGETAAVRPGR